MKISIDEIIPHPLNEEIYDLSNLEDLSKSIKEVGLLQPIIINQHNQIISGHRRFECIKKIGWMEVDVEVRNIDEKETDFYLVQFNKQRVKTTREILNEFDIIEKHYENKRDEKNLTSFITKYSKRMKYPTNWCFIIMFQNFSLENTEKITLI